MKLDVKHFANAILEIEEKEPESNHEYKQILGLASGNKKYLAKATLEDIVDLLENLDVILSKELRDDFPHIDLEAMPGTKMVIRRAI